MKRLDKIILTMGLFAFFMASSFTWAHQTQVLTFEYILVNQFQIHKMVHAKEFSRTVYYDGVHQQFIKLWQVNYPLANNFLRALNQNCFEEISPLNAIIFDEQGHCRGYISYACQDLEGACSSLKVKMEKNIHGFVRLKEIAEQPLVFQIFYNKILTNAQKTGMIYLDFVPSNLAIDHDHFVLLDLEGFYTVEELREWQKADPGYFEFILRSLPIEYCQFIQGCLAQTNLLVEENLNVRN